MKKYLVINTKDVVFSPDYQECQTPIHKKWVKTDIFKDGYPFSQDDVSDWPWFIFDYDTGVLYDMATDKDIAEETIRDVYNGVFINYDDTIKNKHDDDYDRAMSIL
jgi:hypothetical protein